jgi:6-phosphofructokinase 1
VATLAVMTSGGDAPGMNAAIRAITRMGIVHGHRVFGIRNGYKGLLSGDLIPLDARAVGGVVGHGGTVLGTARCPAFETLEGVTRGREVLDARGIEAIFVIGGNGSQTGALSLAQQGVRVIGVASTIDNDLLGSEPSIGVTTALDVAVEAIDRLRTTARALRRAFIVEVMGRHSGYLALVSAIAGGAEWVMLPEEPSSADAMMMHLNELHDRNRTHAIVVVAEGAYWNADRLESYLKGHPDASDFETRVTKLGHVQRGGVPGVFDRMLATSLGCGAIEAFEGGLNGVLVGLLDGQVTSTPLEALVGKTKPFPSHLHAMAKLLAR